VEDRGVSSRTFKFKRSKVNYTRPHKAQAMRCAITNEHYNDTVFILDSNDVSTKYHVPKSIHYNDTLYLVVMVYPLSTTYQQIYSQKVMVIRLHDAETRIVL